MQPMTVDERIEALTARHEALTQSVELLGSFHRDTEEAMRKLDEKLTEKIAANADNIAQISQLVLIHDRMIKELGKQ